MKNGLLTNVDLIMIFKFSAFGIPKIKINHKLISIGWEKAIIYFFNNYVLIRCD